jgi:hypothetical protein
MNNSRWERLAPLTGVAFVVLLVAGVLVINNYDYLPPAEEIKSFYEDGSTRITAGGYLALLSVFFFLWFVGSVRSSLRVAEGGTGRLSAVAFGGGVAAGAGMIVGYAAVWAAAQRAGADGGIAAETATGLFDLSGVLIGNTVPIAFAVLIGATAVLSFRTGVFARWLAWVSAVIAVGLLTPVNYIFIGIALLWVLVVSILLYTSDRSTSPT